MKEEKWFMSKWVWKMDYCRNNGLPPAQKWAWDMAEEVYRIKIRK